MGRHIAIIGAGQSGLQLGIGLLKNGYSVSLYNDRSAEDILNGKITSSQGMFDIALSYERALSLNYWDDIAPKNTTVSFVLSDPAFEKPAITWNGSITPYQSIDQRLKFPRWIQTFIGLGGEFILSEITIETLDKISKEAELTIVATGKGKIGSYFEVDKEKSSFSRPVRQLALCYANNTHPSKNIGVHANIIPGVGEFFTMPGLTLNGHCEMMLFEGLFGGPFDCWANIQSPEEQLEKSIALLKKYVPWEAVRFEQAQLTDKQATLIGSYTPVVKHPILTLPSGNKALGIGDAIILNDPIAGQGSNNASKCAQIYLKQIIAQGNAPFNLNWMQKTFDMCWSNARWSTAWSNMLLSPPPPHLISLFQEAQKKPFLADYLASVFDDPEKVFPWILTPEGTEEFLMNQEILEIAV